MKKASRPKYITRKCNRHGEVQWVRRSDGGYRCSVCLRENPKQIRLKNKKVLIKEQGGKCIICGYKKSTVSLTFHHLDPTTKEFNISGKNLNKPIEVLREEASKCMLLCANCHGEVHAGLIDVNDYMGRRIKRIKTHKNIYNKKIKAKNFNQTKA